MEFSQKILSFLELIEDDPRIGPSHISLFLAILYASKEELNGSPITVFKKDIIKHAKISEGTYHRCMHQLTAYGYLKYNPSFNPMSGSLVKISKLDV